MMHAVRFALVGVLALFALQVPSPAEARNTPCSGKKGGIKACQGEKFLCQDGSLSASKKRCSR